MHWPSQDFTLLMWDICLTRQRCVTFVSGAEYDFNHAKVDYFVYGAFASQGKAVRLIMKGCAAFVSPCLSKAPDRSNKELNGPGPGRERR